MWVCGTQILVRPQVSSQESEEARYFSYYHFPPCLIPSGLHQTRGTWLEPQLVLCKPAVVFSGTGVLWPQPKGQANPSLDAANHMLKPVS